MQLTSLHPHFNKLQKKFGDPALRAIYGAGCVKRPKVCFVFMNPTARNISTVSAWGGLRAPWLGTKNIWKLMAEVGVIARTTNKTIQSMAPADWTEGFSRDLYTEIAEGSFFITNLAKCTQPDARALPDAYFKAYRELFMQELAILQPSQIISFGNQVSSILCQTPVRVSEFPQKSLPLEVVGRSYSVWPTFYPVGQGFRNTPKAVANIKWVLSTLE